MAWLGVIAWLLLVAAPTVSRTLVAASLISPADAACAMHAHASHGKASPVTLDDCGYCSLLCDSPGVTLSVGLAVMALPPVAPEAVATIIGADQRPYQGAQSRGPPRV